MNPEINRFEEIPEDKTGDLANERVEEIMKRRLQAFFDQDGTKGEVLEVPIFKIGEELVLRGYRFRVSTIEPGRMILEPVGVFSNTKIRRDSKKSRGRSKKKRKSGSRRKR
jgi:hypothetical protein